MAVEWFELGNDDSSMNFWRHFLFHLTGRHRFQVWHLFDDGIWRKKMATMKVGQFYLATVTASDGLSPASLVATPSDPAILSIGVGPSANVIQVNAIAPGTATVTYSAPGYKPVVESNTVNDTPSLIVTDGPIQG